MIGWLVNIPPNISPSFVGKYITIIHTCPMCEPMVLVYKNLQNWMILFGQMVINIPDMEHMGVAVGWTTRYAPVAVVLQLQEMKLVTHQSTTISLFNGLVCKNLNRKPSIFPWNLGNDNVQLLLMMKMINVMSMWQPTTTVYHWDSKPTNIHNL